MSQETFPGHQELKKVLLKKLVRFEPLPINSNELFFQSKNIIYVLGGSPRILKIRFETASELYKNGVAQKILVGSQEMLMGFSPVLGRNLAFDEWSSEKLKSLGVNEKDIEYVTIEKGNFGTLTEAKRISNLILKRGYRGLILVTSTYHTMRTWNCFSKFLKNHDVRLYVYPASDYPNLLGLLREYFKLIIYKSFLLFG